MGFTAFDLITVLRSGDPAIVTRDHKANLGVIAIDPRPISQDEARLITERIRAFYITMKAKA